MDRRDNKPMNKAQKTCKLITLKQVCVETGFHVYNTDSVRTKQTDSN